MLLLSNAEIAELLDMRTCMEALEQAYAELGAGRAANVPRADIVVPTSRPGVMHGMKTMSGSIPALGVAALRLNSDIIHWPEVNGVPRRVKIPAAPGGKWVGLVLIFSTETGEPLAIFPDGVMQRMRVGGTSGLAARYLARNDASTLGLLGAGWQAGAQAMAMAVARPIRRVWVYSPTPAHREALAQELRVSLGLEAVAVESPEEAVREADIVSCATNALGTVFYRRWLRPGQHVTCVRPHEIEAEVYLAADRLAQNVRDHSAPQHRLVGEAGDIPELKHGWQDPAVQKVDWSRVPELSELVAGKVKGRERPEEVTCFNNNIGLGFQFAAVGARVLELARARGVGRELPVEWFVQDVHP